MSAETMGKVNKEYFDKHGSKYDAEDWQKKMIAYTIMYLRSQLAFIGISDKQDRPLRMLDYACGPGTVSEALGPYMAECRGLDVSEVMVERYNQAAEAGKFGATPCSASLGNLFLERVSETLASEELYDFDLVSVGWALHHFHDPHKAIVKLAERLRPGGVILIIDFEADGHVKDAGEISAGIHNHGLSEATMREVFGQAGLVNIGHQRMPEKLELHLPQGKVLQRGFLGRAEKPASASP